MCVSWIAAICILFRVMSLMISRCVCSSSIEPGFMLAMFIARSPFSILISAFRSLLHVSCFCSFPFLFSLVVRSFSVRSLFCFLALRRFGFSSWVAFSVLGCFASVSVVYVVSLVLLLVFWCFVCLVLFGVPNYCCCCCWHFSVVSLFSPFPLSRAFLFFVG